MSNYTGSDGVRTSCSKDVCETASMRDKGRLKKKKKKKGQTVCSEVGTHTCGQITGWQAPWTPVTTPFPTYLLIKQQVLPTNGEDFWSHIEPNLEYKQHTSNSSSLTPVLWNVGMYRVFCDSYRRPMKVLNCFLMVKDPLQNTKGMYSTYNLRDKRNRPITIPG